MVIGRIIVCFISASLLFQSALLAQSKKAMFWVKREKGAVQCMLCPRRCFIPEGQKGICRTRQNIKGVLFTLNYNNPVAVHNDPIEKKPFFHVWPGARALSIALAGCNMRCLFCQNWQISQAEPGQLPSYNLSPQQAVDLAKEHNIDWIVYTYSEPTVFYEYMLETARKAKQAGLMNGMHSCGYINPEPLKQLLPYMDAVNIDLKGFSEEFYNKIGLMASIRPVLESLKIIKGSGVWLEITCLIIPGVNDSPDKVREMSKWIVENLGGDVPVHFSRFYPQYKMTNLPPTPVSVLERCAEIAREEGIRYVYIGNVPGHNREDTYCPFCGRLLIDRDGYDIIENNIENGKCKFCGKEIPGLWREQR